MHNKTKGTEQDAVMELAEVLYQCQKCENKCEKKVTFMKHKNTKHQPDGSIKPDNIVDVVNTKDKFHSDECNYSCKANQSLKKHQEQNHIIEDLNTCNECDYKSISKSDLKDHINIIHKEDCNNSKSDYDNYPEVEESELDGWIAKAAEKKNKKYK